MQKQKKSSVVIVIVILALATACVILVGHIIAQKEAGKEIVPKVGTYALDQEENIPEVYLIVRDDKTYTYTDGNGHEYSSGKLEKGEDGYLHLMSKKGEMDGAVVPFYRGTYLVTEKGQVLRLELINKSPIQITTEREDESGDK